MRGAQELKADTAQKMKTIELTEEERQLDIQIDHDSDGDSEYSPDSPRFDPDANISYDFTNEGTDPDFIISDESQPQINMDSINLPVNKLYLNTVLLNNSPFFSP